LALLLIGSLSRSWNGIERAAVQLRRLANLARWLVAGSLQHGVTQATVVPLPILHLDHDLRPHPLREHVRQLVCWE
jgi:hypothetical protein